MKMKQYNLFPYRQVRQMPFGQLTILAIGERGRARYEAIIPFASTISEKDFVELTPTKSGKLKIVPSSESNGWLAVLDSEGCYTRNTLGQVYVQETQKSNIQIAAKGNGAYGHAGRVGTWYAYLAVIKEGTFIWVRPSGGAHKVSRYWLYFGEDKVYRLSKEELPLFCDQIGLEMPDKGSLVSIYGCEDLKLS